MPNFHDSDFGRARRVDVRPAGCAWMVLSNLWQPGRDDVRSNGTSSNPQSSGSASSSDSSRGLELKALKKKQARQKQTARARAAALQAKAQRRLAKNAEINPPPHAAEKFKHDLQIESDIHRPGQCAGLVRRRRLRLLVSYLKSWCAAIANFFQSCGHIDHTILVSVVDDTSLRLGTAVPGTQWRMSRVTSVMNNIQNLVVCYRSVAAADANQPCHEQRSFKGLHVQTPMVALPKTDRDSISGEFASRLFYFLGRVSVRYCHFNIAQDFLKRVRIQGLVLVFDSLKTNVAMLKQFRAAVRSHHEQKHSDDKACDEHVHPVWGVFCGLHQLSLARTPLLRGFANYWGSIVRLAHLFENHGFRQQFRLSLLHIICDSYVFIPVSQLPSQSSEWRSKQLRLCQSNPAGKRHQIHTDRMRWDNSNIDSPLFQHWCLGQHCCAGKTQKERELHGLLQITRCYTLLFCYGYPVPLEYRWVHAQRALDFVREAWF